MMSTVPAPAPAATWRFGPFGPQADTAAGAAAWLRDVGNPNKGLEFPTEFMQPRARRATCLGGNVAVDDDRARFAAVVMPHLADAYGLARAMTGNRTDAEDVVQEACLRAFRAIATLAGSNHRAWVLTIVHHTACTWLGKNRPAVMVTVDDLEAVERSQANPGPHEPETPEAALIAKSDGAQLEAAIAALPVLFRETLVLRDIQGFDYREIARITDVPIGTVMSRLARARARLIAALGGAKP